MRMRVSRFRRWRRSLSRISAAKPTDRLASGRSVAKLIECTRTAAIVARTQHESRIFTGNGERVTRRRHASRDTLAVRTRDCGAQADELMGLSLFFFVSFLLFLFYSPPWH